MIGPNPEEVTETVRWLSLLEAAAYLRMTPWALRYLLIKSGHPPIVKPDEGRAYLTITIREVAELIREREHRQAEIESLPGWSARQVADALGIRADTVHRLRQLGYLPAAHEVEGLGHRRYRWDPAEVRRYARRVGRTMREGGEVAVAEAVPEAAARRRESRAGASSAPGRKVEKGGADQPLPSQRGPRSRDQAGAALKRGKERPAMAEQPHRGTSRGKAGELT